MKTFIETVEFLAKERLTRVFEGYNDTRSPGAWLVAEIYDMPLTVVQEKVDRRFKALCDEHDENWRKKQESALVIGDDESYHYDA